MEFGTAGMGNSVVSIASWSAGHAGGRRGMAVAESSIVQHWELTKQMTDEEKRKFFDTARARRLEQDRAKGGHLAKDGTVCGDGLLYHPGCTSPGKGK